MVGAEIGDESDGYEWGIEHEEVVDNARQAVYILDRQLSPTTARIHGDVEDVDGEKPVPKMGLGTGTPPT